MHEFKPRHHFSLYHTTSSSCSSIFMYSTSLYLLHLLILLVCVFINLLYRLCLILIVYVVPLCFYLSNTSFFY